MPPAVLRITGDKTPGKNHQCRAIVIDNWRHHICTSKLTADGLTARCRACAKRVRKGDANDVHTLDNAAPDAAAVLLQQEAGGVDTAITAAADALGALI
jgi:hypothetical protein